MVKDIYNTLKFITNHPLTRDHKTKTLIKYFKWQIRSTINPHPIVYQWIGKTKLIVKKGLTGATGNYYTGLHEYESMSLLLHFLKEGDLFVDVGANVGSYTILAAGCNKANVIAIEPTLESFKLLMENIALNNIDNKVVPLNICAGSKKQVIKFVYDKDTMNHVYVEGEESKYINIQMDILDNILTNKDPIMIKIDVEGYEGEIFKGAMNIIRNETLKIIILEMGNLMLRYGNKPNDIHQFLLKNKFKTYKYDPVIKKLTRNDKILAGDVIYLRDIDFVAGRLNGIYG